MPNFFLPQNFHSLRFCIILFNLVTPSISGYDPVSTLWSQRQTQISNLFNFFCPRNNDQSQAIQSTFDPLNYLSLFPNPTTVRTFTTALHSGKLFPRSKSFVKGGVARDEMIQLLEILYFIDISTPSGWDLFYNTTAFYSLRVNVGQFYWAMGTIFSTKLLGLVQPPPFRETIPQFYTAKEEIRATNGFSKSPPAPPGGHVVAFDEPSYWMSDPFLGEFHFWWHTDLENVLDNKKFGLLYDRKGESFFYVHHQIMTRYIAERRSSRLGDIQPLSLSRDFRIEKGYEAYHLDINLAEFPIRGQNAGWWNQEGYEDMVLSEKRIFEAVESGYAIHIAIITNQATGQPVPLRANPETFDSEILGSDVLGDLVESSTLSINLKYYKALHGNIHGNLGNLKDPRYPQQVPTVGVQDHQEVNVADPVFYQIHAYIDNLFRRHKYLSPQIRTEQELLYPGVDLYSVRLDRINQGPQALPGPQILTTFFEQYTFDISNAVVDCKKLEQGGTFQTKRQRLNYHEFLYSLEIYSHRFQSENAIVRIFMAPFLDAQGRPNSPDDLHWNMIEMDRFPIVLRSGWNRIQRSSKDSVITVKEGVRACGWPAHLLLPRGTVEGLAMKMFVILTPAGTRRGVTYTVDSEKFYPSHTFCGHPYLPYPDDRPMGYPFDKKLQFDAPLSQVRRNYGFYDVIIKHLSQK